MTQWQVRRAKLAWRFGVGLVVVGLIPVIWFVIRSLQPAAVPGLPATWVSSMEAWLPLHKIGFIAHPVHAELVFTLAALALMWLGSTIAGRQRQIFELHKRDAEDRQRRAHVYAGEGRLEPYIGAPLRIAPDSEPQ